MKKVLVLSVIFAVIAVAVLGSLMIFEILSLEQGFNYLVKALAAIVLLGGASAVILLVMGDNRETGD